MAQAADIWIPRYGACDYLALVLRGFARFSATAPFRAASVSKRFPDRTESHGHSTALWGGDFATATRDLSGHGRGLLLAKAGVLPTAGSASWVTLQPHSEWRHREAVAAILLRPKRQFGGSPCAARSASEPVSGKLLRGLVGPVGFEPTTNGL